MNEDRAPRDCGRIGLVSVAPRAGVGVRAGHCEATVVSNTLLGRDDQVGCPLFWPIDTLEETARRRQRGSTTA